MTDLTVVGAGGNASPIAELAESCGFTVVRYLDDDATKAGTAVEGVPIEGPIESGLAGLPSGSAVAVSFGNNAARARVLTTARDLGLALPALVSPLAVISPTATYEDAVCIHPLSQVWSHSHLGFGTVLHPHSTVAHHVTTGSACFLATGVNLGGTITIGDLAMFGTGSTVSSSVATIGENTFVGAGAVVIRDTEPNGVYVGNPARLLCHQEPIEQ